MGNAAALLSAYGAPRLACAVTHGVTLNDSTDGAVNTLQNYVTASFTPAANDLLVVGVIWSTASGTAAGSVAMSNSAGLTFSQVNTTTSSGARQSLVFIATALAANSSQTVTAGVTPTGGVAAGGCNITVLRVAGMAKSGATAVLQSAKSTSSPATTPAPAFANAAAYYNPCIGFVFNASNPATMVQPALWTELNDSGYATVATGIESAARNSGFTNTTVTWASTTATASANYIIELDNT